MGWTVTRRAGPYPYAEAQEWARETVALLVQDVRDRCNLESYGLIIREEPDGTFILTAEAVAQIKVQGPGEEAR